MFPGNYGTNHLIKALFFVRIHDISCILTESKSMEQSEELRYLLLAVQREGNRQFSEALRPLKLTPAQSEVIQVLQQYQPMTLLQLGERLICESGSPSRLVKSMVESGWVKKLPNPADGRAVLLRLTPATEAILPALNEIETQFNAQAGSFVSDNLLKTIVDELWRFVGDSPSGQALKRRKNNT
jgi:DNA-binding MarR family transcriptional regulator